MKILIVGGYGVFGGRLAHLLAGHAALDLVIAGRNLAAATQFCAGWHGAATLTPLRLDRTAPGAGLADLRPDLVVDASGPFQDYGADPYGLVGAALAVSADYIDLADGTAFVAGISRFDAMAKAAGRFVLSGASSFPVLTVAVVRELAQGMAVTGVTAGIAPSPYAGVGLNVLRAVLGYAGKPVMLRRGGQDRAATGLGESRTMVVAVPGSMPLHPLRFSLVEVPDLAVIPALFPGVTDVWVGAAPQPGLLLAVLNLMARLRRYGLLPGLSPLAPLCHWLLNRLALGEHRGGMVVKATGLTPDGATVTRSWHMLAEGDDGPLIPVMAVAALVAKLVAGQRPAPGARAASDMLTLADYQGQFARRRIVTGFRGGGASLGLWRDVLGPGFDSLPAPLRALHGVGGQVWQGRADVTAGPGPLAALVRRLFGFPRAGQNLPLRFELQPLAGGGERWLRHYPGCTMRSDLRPGSGRTLGLIEESFGPIHVAIAILRDGDGISFVTRRWRIGPLPLPRWALPGGTAREFDDAGRFGFDIKIRVPLVGLVVAYRGWLVPAS